VQIGQPATAFATIINTGMTTAHGCSIALVTVVPASFLYQTTDPHTNKITGTPNTPVDIPSGGAQTFLIALTPTAEFRRTVEFRFACIDVAPAVSIHGVNTIIVAGSSAPQPDIIMVALTPSNDGIVTIPRGGTGVFVVAMTNIGATFGTAGSSGQSISEWQSTDSMNLPSISLCETDPINSQCIPPPGGSGRRIAAGETATFAVFVASDHAIPFDPATNRIGVEVWEQFVIGIFEGLTLMRGATSIAVRTEP
jgi:hypothetical protein